MNYAGDVSPREAWARLQEDSNALLVDVRTPPEWQYVGVPDLTSLGKHVIAVSWSVYPSMEANSSFVANLEEHGVKQSDELYMLCRSGARSVAAALAANAAGYKAYNVLEGFEGEKDPHQHRGLLGGWKVAGLPWQQG